MYPQVKFVVVLDHGVVRVRTPVKEMLLSNSQIVTELKEC